MKKKNKNFEFLLPIDIGNYLYLMILDFIQKSQLSSWIFQSPSYFSTHTLKSLIPSPLIIAYKIFKQKCANQLQNSISYEVKNNSANL